VLIIDYIKLICLYIKDDDKMGRNKAPSNNTVRILCGKAAGMCEFEGCNKRLFYDGVTLSAFNNAYVAHIVASSAKGPRGHRVLSAQLSDKLDNLMLMCADHHKLIDQSITGPRDYPVEKLQAMKREHEEKIERICNLFHVPKTEIVCLSSPIKGNASVNIDYNMAAKAVLPRKQPMNPYSTDVKILSSRPYRSREYWEDCCTEMESWFKVMLYGRYIQYNKADFSVFSLAPIPLIIKFGEMIGDKLPCDIYQKTRYPDTWEWQSMELTNKFTIESTSKQCVGNKVALIISLSNDIQDERVLKIDKYHTIYKIKAETLGVDCIKSPHDLSEFWHVYQQVMDQILNEHGGECQIHLFSAMPVSAAFEVGRRYMPNVYPKVTIFEEDNGFFETIQLGDGKSYDR